MNVSHSLPAQNGARSVDRASALLGRVARHPEAGTSLGTLVAETGLNKPTARRLLLALVRARLVDQDAGIRLYRLGPEA